MQYTTLNELHMYGSSRLSVMNIKDTVYGTKQYFNFTLSSAKLGTQFKIENIDRYTLDSIYHLQRGRRYYEGSNHLGNVLVVYSDKRLYQCSGTTTQRYMADVVQAQHYYVFGATMPGLTFTSNTAYRFGFNTQEREDKIAGKGNIYTAEFWEYDARLGRRWNRDPVVKPWASPYACFGNNPIWLIDRKGDDYINTHTKEREQAKKKKEKAQGVLEQAQKDFSLYAGLTKAQVKELKKTNKDEYKRYKDAKRNLKDAQEAFDQADRRYKEALELEAITELALAEFAEINPALYEQWKRFNPLGRKVIDIQIAFQYNEIPQRRKTGEIYGYTTERVDVAIGMADPNNDHIIITLKVMYVNGVAVVSVNTSDLVHALGHVLGGDERTATQYATDNYDLPKKKKLKEKLKGEK